MSENQIENVQTPVNSNTPKGNAMLYTGIGLVLLVGAGGFFLTNKNSKQSKLTPTPAVESAKTLNNKNTYQDEEQAENDGGADDLTENGNTSANTNVSPTGTAALQSGVINVEGGMYYFKPNVIRVKKGQPVKIVFTNVEGIHDFVIDKFEVQSKQIREGQSDTIQFTPDQAGSFEFYCSIGNHKAMGMKGTLIVE